MGAFFGVLTEGLEVHWEDGPAVMRQGRVMHESGAAACDITTWMCATQGESQNNWRVESTPICADAMRPWWTRSLQWVVRWVSIEKGASFSRRPLISLQILAPQPGLEPGTYGLTVRRSTD